MYNIRIYEHCDIILFLLYLFVFASRPVSIFSVFEADFQNRKRITPTIPDEIYIDFMPADKSTIQWVAASFPPHAPRFRLYYEPIFKFVFFIWWRRKFVLGVVISDSSLLTFLSLNSILSELGASEVLASKV